MSEMNRDYVAGPRRVALVQVGGALGIAACIIGLAIFLAGCAGYGAVFNLSMIPLALGFIGLVLAIVGGFVQKTPHLEDTAAIAAMFVSILGVIGGLLEVGAWCGWTILAR